MCVHEWSCKTFHGLVGILWTFYNLFIIITQYSYQSMEYFTGALMCTHCFQACHAYMTQLADSNMLNLISCTTLIWRTFLSVTDILWMCRKSFSVLTKPHVTLSNCTCRELSIKYEKAYLMLTVWISFVCMNVGCLGTFSILSQYFTIEGSKTKHKSCKQCWQRELGTIVQLRDNLVHSAGKLTRFTMPGPTIWIFLRFQ